MKSTDLRAKARAIFGPAIAEPMPNQPNGAKALQQRANARPIPTYKVGGAVKKADGGMMKPKVSAAERKMGDALMMKRKGKEIMAAQAKRDAEKERMGMAKRAVADKLLGIPAQKKGGKAGCYSEGGRMKGSTDSARMKGSTDAARMKGSTDSARVSVTPDEKRKKIDLNEKRVRVPSIEHKDGGSIMKKAAGGGMSPFGKAFADARKRGEKTFNFGGKSYTTETREDVQKRAMAASAEREKRAEAGRAAMRQKTAAGTEERGKSPFQRSTDKFYKKYPEAMKKGGKAKDGLAVMIAIGKPMKGMKKPVKRAVGGAGKTRKGMC